PVISQQSQAEFPQLDSGLAVPSFLPGDDLIATEQRNGISKHIYYLTLSHNQQPTQDIFQPKKPCYNLGWQSYSLTNLGVAQGPYTWTTMAVNATFQTDDLDAFDLDCDEAPSVRAVLMANLSSYDSDAILEELSAEQAFWLLISNSISEQLVVPPTPVKTEAPRKLPMVVQIVLWYLVSSFSKHITRQRSQLINFVDKFLGTVRFGQFCDSNLEVAFQKHTCFVCKLEGVDILRGSRGTNLYILSLDDMVQASLICLLSKALKTKSWLWHRRLSYLNFGTIN
nr:hypothetical protein [Tanacetum cinerariifolium]